MVAHGPADSHPAGCVCRNRPAENPPDKSCVGVGGSRCGPRYGAAARHAGVVVSLRHGGVLRDHRLRHLRLPLIRKSQGNFRMDRTARPLVIVAAFSASLVVGLLLMLWAMGGLKHVAAPAAIGGPF